jgi:hypothetical protein
MTDLCNKVLDAIESEANTESTKEESLSRIAYLVSRELDDYLDNNKEN